MRSERKLKRPGPASAVVAAVILVTGAASAQSPIRFEEISAKAGTGFEHRVRSFGSRPKAQVLEMFTEGGASVAMGDYDGDGWEDLFFTSSAEDARNALMRNQGDGTFEDLAAQAGVAGGNDAASIVADALFFDYDNDGAQDLLVARFGRPLLYRNLGRPATSKGSVRFAEVGQEAGLIRFGNTIAAITFDYDNDGFLDLVLGNYFQEKDLLNLKDPYVLPNNLDDAVNGGGVTLWRNEAGPGGERRFREVTQEAGFGHHTGWTLDLGHGDFNNDGFQDLYIACDYGTDRLFLNQGNGSFKDTTRESMGFDTKKGMNADVADFNGDGALDIYVTNITDEYMKECNMLWAGNGDGTFVDVARETGTCDTDWGWGAKLGDFDNDGWPDLFVANGLRSAGPDNYIPVLLEMILTPGIDFSDLRSYPDIGGMTWSGYQKKRLFHNLGSGAFKELAAAAGVDNLQDGRGVGLGDLDHDGRLDLIQTSAKGRALHYRNLSETRNWLSLELVGTRSNRNAIGARATVTAGGRTRIAEVNGGNGYAAQSSFRLHFGLGAATQVESLEVRWPSGRTETFAVEINRRARLEEGKGQAVKP